MNITHPKTKTILDWFEKLNQVPRKSKEEEKIRAWLMSWAKEHSFAAKEDAVGNILIKIPGTTGYKKSPVVVLQGHMDMVCEKTPTSKHDFQKDPIKFVYDGDWLKADETTLGADNGIAIAMAMTLALDKDAPHPPLEIFLTVDEETGLTGAKSLQTGFLEGKILLNLDSEDEGKFTVGCAGGKDTKISLPLEFAEVPRYFVAYKLSASKMKGGHSGVDINLQRANAIKVLSRAIFQLTTIGDLRIGSINGGTVHNAIPRDANAVLFFARENVAAMQQAVAEFEAVVKNEFALPEPDLKLTLEAVEDVPCRKAMTACASQKCIDFIIAIPHGVAAMSTGIPTLVETSNNLATIKVEDNALKIVTSQRSSVMSRLDAHTYRIEGIVRLSGGTAKSGSGYPAWEPNWKSPLLARCKELYKKMYGKEAVVEVIHAGLECGIIGDKCPGMDMISIGPTLQNPHSPDERIYVPDIGKVWDFLLELLKSYK
jgi:dipeptidase D